MNSKQPARRGRGAAPLVIGVLAGMAGMLFAGTGAETQPPGEAREHAERVAAVRLAAGATLEDWRAPAPTAPPPAERHALLPDTDVVRLPSHATRVVVPSVGIDADVRPVGLVFRGGGLQYDTPAHEAGQYVGSVSPGASGNTVIGGHVATRGGAAVFRELPNVTVGAIIEVHRGEQTFEYQVTEVRVVAPDATAVMGQTQDATLTLITCSTDQARSQRVVVVGKLL